MRTPAMIFLHAIPPKIHPDTIAISFAIGLSGASLPGAAASPAALSMRRAAKEIPEVAREDFIQRRTTWRAGASRTGKMAKI